MTIRQQAIRHCAVFASTPNDPPRWTTPWRDVGVERLTEPAAQLAIEAYAVALRAWHACHRGNPSYAAWLTLWAEAEAMLHEGWALSDWSSHAEPGGNRE